MTGKNAAENAGQKCLADLQRVCIVHGAAASGMTPVREGLRRAFVEAGRAGYVLRRADLTSDPQLAKLIAEEGQRQAKRTSEMLRGLVADINNNRLAEVEMRKGSSDGE
jgi:hypothetical protein